MNKIIYIFLFISSILANNDTVTISGVVTDEGGEPIPGVTVKVEGTTIATLTNIDGEYLLSDIPDHAKKIEFSYIGMETQTIRIKNRTVINIVMQASDATVDDVVVTALGSKTTKRDRTSGITVVYEKVAYDAPVVHHDADYSDDYRRSSSSSNTTSSGQLTAGEVNDFGKWEMWQDITTDELSQYRNLWQLYPNQRYSVLITSETNTPVIDATIYLKSGNKTLWTAKTDNTGKAELWANMFDSTSLNRISFQVEYKGSINSINNPSTFHNGINKLTIDTHSQCDIPENVDIAFVFDATGSMADEMKYLQAEILDVIDRIDSTHANLTVNLGSVFYRDIGDTYLTVQNDLTEDIPTAVDFFKNQSAGGGGDFPEAVHSGLEIAINQFSWSNDARARIIFLVLDAPPHEEKNIIDSLNILTQQAAKLGIRIVPITCSGVDKSTEYLMRSMALATNGTYVFLTDDSAIGNSHIKPTTDKWNVEFLNDLIVRLVNQYVTTPDCDNIIVIDDYDLQNDTILVNYPDTLIAIVDSNIINSTLITQVDTSQADTTQTTYVPPVEHKLKIYPNPTSGPLTIELEGEIEEFYVCDMSGKILQRHLVDNQSEIRIDIGTYTNGIYFIRYFVDDKLKSGKVILMR